MAGSNLFPGAFVWVITCKSAYSHVFCSNSAYPQHSGERYRISGPLGLILGKIRVSGNVNRKIKKNVALEVLLLSVQLYCNHGMSQCSLLMAFLMTGFVYVPQVVNFASPSQLEQCHTIEDMKVVNGEPKGKAQMLMARLIDTSANSQVLLNANRPRETKQHVQNGLGSKDGKSSDEKVLWCFIINAFVE